MDKIPPEICTKIFSHACLDSGYTGRSLSLVSKFIRETSQPVKLQSIYLRGSDQALAFASILKRVPPHLRSVRYLFISSRGPDPFKGPTDDLKSVRPPTEDNNTNFTDRTYVPLEQEMDQEALRAAAQRFRKMAVLGKQMARAVQDILTDIAESLEILEVAFSDHITSNMNTTHPISLPRLTELTTHDGFPLGWMDHSKILTPCYQLRRLHITQCRTNDLFGSIRALAPFLTHLRFSGLQQESWFGADLEVALGISEELAGYSLKQPVTRLPLSVQKVFVRPAAPPFRGGWCGTASVSYGTLLRHLRSLNEKEDRFVLLKAQKEWTSSQIICEEGDWLDRIGGGEGCWSLEDMIPRTGFVPEGISMESFIVENGL